MAMALTGRIDLDAVELKPCMGDDLRHAPMGFFKRVRDGGAYCKEKCPYCRWVCTRPTGHTGPHVAHYGAVEAVRWLGSCAVEVVRHELVPMTSNHTPWVGAFHANYIWAVDHLPSAKAV